MNMNKNEDIAMCKEDIDNSKFISKGFANISEITTHQHYIEYFNKLQNVFINREICAYCKAWRICLGKFKKECETNSKPKDFFIEVFDAIMLNKNSQNKKN